MKLYFVRHGQTQYNKEGRATGRVDDSLIEEGMKEAENTAKELPKDFDVIYSSDLIRCKQTTEILNKKLNLPVIYDSRLRERDFGSLAGKPWKEWDPDMLQKDRHQQYDYRPLGGESVDDVKSRVLNCISDIQKKSKGDKVLISTHGGIIRLLHNILNGEVHEKIHNSSMYEFEFPDVK